MIVRTGRDVDRDTVFFDRLRSNGFAVEDISAEVRETLPPAVASLLRVAATEEPYAPAWTIERTMHSTRIRPYCWKTWLEDMVGLSTLLEDRSACTSIKQHMTWDAC